MPPLESIETRTEDGWTLRGVVHRPHGAAQAVAVLGHAMWVDSRTLDRPRGAGLATTLAGRGIAVLRFDLRGHGRSGPSAHEGARYTYDDFVQRDVPALVEAARARSAGLPVVLVGHSLTGHAGLIAAGLWPRRAPDAIVALAANLWLPRFEPSRRRRLAKAAALAAWAAVTAPRGHFDARALRVGTDPEPWSYVRHYLRMYAKDRLTSIDGRMDYLAALGEVGLPVLSVTSRGDRWLAHPDDTRRFLRTLRRAEIAHRVIEPTQIAPPPGHMGVVVSPRCRVVWEEIASWILQRLGRGGCRARQDGGRGSSPP